MYAKVYVIMITPLSNNNLTSSSAFGAGTQGVKAGLEQAQDNAAALARRGVEDGLSRASDDQTTVPNPSTAQNLTGQNPTETGQVGANPQTNLASDTVSELNGGGVYSLESSVVGLKQAEQQVGASANVIRTADEVIGSLINTRA